MLSSEINGILTCWTDTKGPIFG